MLYCKYINNNDYHYWKRGIELWNSRVARPKRTCGKLSLVRARLCNKYTYFASKARAEGFNQIAAIFEETAGNEKEHAKIWFKPGYCGEGHWHHC